MKQGIVVAVLSILVCTSAVVPAAESEDLTQCRLAWQEVQNGRYEKALTLFEACIKSGNLSQASLARTYRNIGITYRLMGQPRQAIDVYDKALALQPDDPWDDHMNQGNAWSDLGNAEQALKCYDLALQLKPGYHEAHYNRGIVFERQGQLEQAKAEFVRAYEAGLRSKLLLNRLVTHGLIETTLEKGASMPAPPAGYDWTWLIEARCAVLHPEGWSFKKVKTKNQLAYYITQENIDAAGRFITGLSVRVTNVANTKGVKPSQFAADYVQTIAKTRKVIMPMWTQSKGPFSSVGVTLLNPDPKLGDYYTHNLAIANDTTGALYLIVFEGPEESRATSWKIGEPILNKLFLDPSF